MKGGVRVGKEVNIRVEKANPSLTQEEKKKGAEVWQQRFARGRKRERTKEKICESWEFGGVGGCREVRKREIGCVGCGNMKRLFTFVQTFE